MLVIKSNTEEDNAMDAFYSPISKYGYLTPLQRKKMREKRNLSLSPEEASENHQCPKSRSLKKQKTKSHPKPKLKIQSKELLRKKIVKAHLPEVRCTADQLISHNKNTSSEVKKFFKNRSPEHFKKANYVVPLVYKRSRLDFIDVKNSPSAASHLLRNDNSSQINAVESVPLDFEVDQNNYKRSRLDFIDVKHSPPSAASHLLINDNSSQINAVESVSLNFEVDQNNSDVQKVTEKPCLVKVTPVKEKDTSTVCEFKKTCKDQSISPSNLKQGLSAKERLLIEIQESFFDDSEFIPGKSFYTRQNESKTVNQKSDLDVTSSTECSMISTSTECSMMNTSTDNSMMSDYGSPKASAKLYPLFYMKKEKLNNKSILSESTVAKRSFRTKDLSKGCEQMIIDAGQKEIGAKQCKKCSMIYTIGQEEDERLHSKYHDMYLVNLRFPGWKEENVIARYDEGRVLMVKEDDKHKKLKKIQDVLVIANRDLGFPSTSFPVRPNVTFLLFISNDKRVIGCLVAESITSASPVMLDDTSTAKKEEGKAIWKLGNWYASSESVPAICGINRIWVANNYRRNKIASKMVDCLRSNFIYGHVVSLQALAFTDPSPDGREFAAHYTGTDNFLVYK